MIFLVPFLAFLLFHSQQIHDMTPAYDSRLLLQNPHCLKHFQFLHEDIPELVQVHLKVGVRNHGIAPAHKQYLQNHGLRENLPSPGI